MTFEVPKQNSFQYLRNIGTG